MIPTAEEFFNDMKYVTYSTEEKLITFAKLHVEAQNKAILEKAKTYDNGGWIDGDWIESIEIDKNSILNAYPLTNIK